MNDVVKIGDVVFWKRQQADLFGIVVSKTSSTIVMQYLDGTRDETISVPSEDVEKLRGPFSLEAPPTILSAEFERQREYRPPTQSQIRSEGIIVRKAAASSIRAALKNISYPNLEKLLDVIS